MLIDWFVLLPVGHQSDSVRHIHVSIFFKFFSHIGYYRVLNIVPCPWWLSILNITACTCQSPTPIYSSTLYFPASNYKFVFLVWVCFCFVNNFCIFFSFHTWAISYICLSDLFHRAYILLNVLQLTCNSFETKNSIFLIIVSPSLKIKIIVKIVEYKYVVKHSFKQSACISPINLTTTFVMDIPFSRGRNQELERSTRVVAVTDGKEFWILCHLLPGSIFFNAIF